MEIKKRVRMVTGRPEEYYIFVKTRKGSIIHNDWYTLDEMVSDDFYECSVSKPSLAARIRLVGQPGRYNDLWEAITEPPRKRHHLKNSPPVDSEWINWVQSQMYTLLNVNPNHPQLNFMGEA